MNKVRGNNIYKLNSLTNKKFITVSTKLLKPLNSHQNEIYVDNTDNFKNMGTLIINNEQIHYNNKTNNKFYNIKRGINNSKISSYLKDNIIYQKIINIDDKKNGIFIDNTTQNATFVLSDNNCIKEGAIRFIKDEKNPNNNKFQGCVHINNPKSNNPEIKWVEFNALKGDKGDTGSQSNSKKILSVGDGISVINNDSDTHTELLTLKSKKQSIAGKMEDTILITKEDNNIIFESINKPYIYDLTQPLIKLKNTGDNMLNSWGNKVKIMASSKIEKGQMVLFTNTIINGEKYITASPISLNENNKYKFNKEDCDLFIDNETNSNLIMGLCCNDCSKNEYAYILTDGYGLIKIGNNLSLTSGVVTNIESSYIGANVYMDCDGFGFICNDNKSIEDGTVYCGSILETNDNIGYTNNYVLIKFNPQIINN